MTSIQGYIPTDDEKQAAGGEGFQFANYIAPQQQSYPVFNPNQE